MSRNYESPDEVSNRITSPESDGNKQRADNQQKIGTALLKSIAYQDKIPIKLGEAEASFAKQRHEKDPNLSSINGAERRIYLHLDTIKRAVDAGGDDVEKSILGEIVHGSPDAKISGIHIVTMEDIPESYWRAQEQIMRDQDGRLTKLDDFEKEMLQKDIAERQRESIESWLDYLQSESCPYPTWFKLYALDGVSKMGVFNSKRKQFTKRDTASVAPYSHLDQASLGKVFQAVIDFYDSKPNNANNNQDAELSALVKSGNFNKLYSKFLLEDRNIVEVPKETKDIHGEWIEYNPGDEEKLAVAADGTPWCIASPTVGRNYLEYGDYLGENDPDADSKAKFILFHLMDPKTEIPSASACASIRLDTKGEVAEISGLQEGQALNDSLVPIVEEKVKEFPGGEDFLEAFADKKHLIAIDHKWQSGEDLSQEDIDFINGDFHTLDTYNDTDPRIVFMKEIAIPLQNGEDIDTTAKTQSSKIINNIDGLIRHNISINQIINWLYSDDIVENLDTLIAHNATINQLVSKIYSYQIIENLDDLIARGATIEQIHPHLDSADIIENLDDLIARGATIEQLCSHLDSKDVANNLDFLMAHGADINQLVSRLDDDAIHCLDALMAYGANINQIASGASSKDIIDNLDKLLTFGADVNSIAPELNPKEIAEHLDIFLAHNVDTDRLIIEMNINDIIKNLDTLTAHGADIDWIVFNLTNSEIREHFDTLVAHGADREQLLEDMEAE